MNRIIVAGNGTEVGKTIASAVLVTKLKADYWKPVQCGDPTSSDCDTISRLVDNQSHQIHPPTYTLKAFLSPHHAASLENISIDTSTITPPKTERPIIIESVGGVLVPFTTSTLSIDLFQQWSARWIIVSRHYLGSINHTLLTIDSLKMRGISILGIIFNGDPNPYSESAIIQYSKLPIIGRLLPEPSFNIDIIQRYTEQWHLPS